MFGLTARTSSVTCGDRPAGLSPPAGAPSREGAESPRDPRGDTEDQSDHQDGNNNVRDGNFGW